MVTLGNDIIWLYTLEITNEKPICIHYEVKLTVAYEDEPSYGVQVMLADTINEFLQQLLSDTFRSRWFCSPKDCLFKDMYECDQHLCIKSMKEKEVVKESQ